MRKQLRDLTKWHCVFAWWPVVTTGGERIWLERVERRMWGSSWWEDYFEFRPAIAAATGTAKTPKAVECEASQSVIAHPQSES